MLRKVIAAAALAAATLGATATAADAAPRDRYWEEATPAAVVGAKAWGKKAKLRAWWVRSYRYPDFVICTPDKRTALYALDLIKKEYRKRGYYWGGHAGKRWDRKCTALARKAR